MINVAVIGAGYWGPNLIRNFVSCPRTRLVAVCDKNPARLAKVLAAYPGVEAINAPETIWARDDIDAVAIATPVGSHAALAVAAFEAGKHVLVEKPLASSVRDAEMMLNAAHRANRTLMVDHTFVYSSPVRKIKEIVDAGELGEIYYVDGVRINLGLFQHDVNVVWDLAPHDLSIMDYLIGRLPRSLSAFGACHADSHGNIEDIAYLNLDFGDGLLASFHVNWLSPVKIRHFLIGGSRRGLLYNDLSPDEKIKVYDRGITVSEDPDARHGILVGYRTGDVSSPKIDAVEPLQAMVLHFAECILEGKRPLTDGEAGMRIVRILDAAQRSIKADGGRVTLSGSRYDRLATQPRRQSVPSSLAPALSGGE